MDFVNFAQSYISIENAVQKVLRLVLIFAGTDSSR